MSISFDKQTYKQIGENGSQEYGWSNDAREKVLQISYQLTRTSDTSYLASQLRALLQELVKPSFILVEAERQELLVTLFKLIGHTRDIIDGKGEYALTYMMIYTWYDFYPELAKYALLTCVSSETDQPYGSWKDIKYFCNFCKTQGCSIDHPLISYAISLVTDQLKLDVSHYEKSNFSHISLLCKWIARETSGKFGWIYSSLATSYFSNYLKTAKTPDSLRKATNKAKMDYRKIIANINRALDTAQIKQCSGEWKNIDFDKTTSITIYKQKKAFLNVKRNGSQRTENEDRIECAINFKHHIKGEKNVKGKRIGINAFTSQALQLLQQSNNELEIELLNSQWRDNSSQNGKLENFIAMVDTSASMTSDSGDPLNAAIALGYRVAEKSVLGKRIMTFSAKPTWINLEECETFVGAVDKIRNANWGMNTNFYAAFDMILDTCVENKLDPDLVSEMVLAVFSDMQIDSASVEDSGSMFDIMKQKYEDAGIRAVGKPYKPPHILFWNLRSTGGFPALSRQKNVSMLSGFSPILLNLFCNKGIEALQVCNPWSMFMVALDNPRYKRLENKAIEII